MSIFNSYVSLPEGIIICFLIFHLGKHSTIGDLPLERPWSRSASAKVSTTTATSSGGSDLFKEFFIENLRLLETISKSFKYYEKVDYIILWLFRRNCPGIVWFLPARSCTSSLPPNKAQQREKSPDQCHNARYAPRDLAIPWLIYVGILCWLVVSTPLKNISQLGLLFPIYGKTHVPNHQPVYTIIYYYILYIPTATLNFD